MTGDLLVIVPTRGRPGNLARFLDAVHDTRTAITHVHAAADDDDPEMGAYRDMWNDHAGDGDWLDTGPRDGLIGESAHRASAGDCLVDVHGCLPHFVSTSTVIFNTVLIDTIP